MFDALHSGARASAMACRRAPPYFVAIVLIASSVAGGSASAQTAGTIRPSMTATQKALQPETRVPAPVYRSVFESLPRGVETGAVDWREANALAGQFPRGHADLLKWEQRNPAGLPQRPQGARP